MPRSKTLVPNVFYDCAICERPVARYMTPYDQKQYPPKYCSRACAGIAHRGSGHPQWIGGRVQDGNGYVMIHRPDHPNARAQGYVYEHRLVMEAKLGRMLLPSEVVHHINGDTQDNRPENLMYFPSNAEHKRHEDAERRRNDAGQYLAIGGTR